MTEMVDVLVVGAGPVGLTAAIELRRRNLAVRLIDCKTGPATTSRALGTHSRTLEVYRTMGVLDAILKWAQPLSNFTVHERRSRITRFGYDFGDLGPLKPFSAFIGQADTEGVLRARLEELGVTVEWGVEMTSLAQDGAGVRVGLHDGSTVEAGWVVAADGGKSTTRKLLKLPFEGALDETWIVADAAIETGLPANSIHMFRHHDGNLLIFPFPEAGKWRVLETNPPPAGEEEDKARLMVRFQKRMEAASGCKVALQSLGWVSRFTIQQRQALQLRHGRIFLAGDAAHVHSPASGQGMNTGIQDAFNLAWKLALVHRGGAADALLDSYDAERRPVSADLLKSAKIATRLIQSRRGLTYSLFGAMVRLQDRIPKLHALIERRLTAQLSALPIRYDADGDFAHVGRRFPAIPGDVRDAPAVAVLLDWLGGPGVKLLLAGTEARSVAQSLTAVQLSGDLDCAIVGQEAPQGWTELDVTSGVIPHVLGATGAATAWLIRPDGYLIDRIDAPDDATIGAALARAGLHITGSGAQRQGAVEYVVG